MQHKHSLVFESVNVNSTVSTSRPVHGVVHAWCLALKRLQGCWPKLVVLLPSFGLEGRKDKKVSGQNAAQW